jgi:hypothetical protein
MNNDEKLKGFLQSGIIFIGDPVYMAGDSREGADNSLCNPFQNWDGFIANYGSGDANLPFPGAFNDAYGRGIAVQTNRLSGKYELVKELDEHGRVREIRIVFSE